MAGLTRLETAVRERLRKHCFAWQLMVVCGLRAAARGLRGGRDGTERNGAIPAGEEPFPFGFAGALTNARRFVFQSVILYTLRVRFGERKRTPCGE
jgi:hypothetical protein